MKVRWMLNDVDEHLLGDSRTASPRKAKTLTAKELLKEVQQLKKQASLTKEAGFSSYECLGCGKSLLSEWTVKEVSPRLWWMVKAVVIPKETNEVIIGNYDGYSRIVDKSGKKHNLAEYHWGDGMSCYHEACWKKSGKPTVFTENSKAARDQGFFIEPSRYLRNRSKAQ